MGSRVPQSHTVTEQWQSFEMRMRHRRVQRCLLRASVALEAGVLDDAREFCNEARGLEPYNLEVQELAARIAATPGSSFVDLPSAPFDLRSAPLDRPSAPFDLRSAPLDRPSAPFELRPAPLDRPSAPLDRHHQPGARMDAHDRLRLELDSEPPTEPSRSGRAMAVAAMTVLIAGAAGWFWARSPAERPEASGVLSDAAVPPSTTAPAEPAAVRVDQTAVTAPVTPADARAEIAATTGVPDEGVNPDPRTLALTRDDGAGERTAIAERGVERPTETRAADTAPIAPVDPPPPSAVASTPAVAPAAGIPVVVLPEPASVDVPASPPSGLNAATLAGTPVDLRNAAMPAVPPAPAPEPPARSGDDKNIRTVLARYEAAYNRLDASAAATVWPSADRRGLTRAFDALTAQRVSLGRCDVRITGSSAEAICAGTQRWTPKVGGTQSAPRQWRFDLRNTGDHWVISQVAVQ